MSAEGRCICGAMCIWRTHLRMWYSSIHAQVAGSCYSFALQMLELDHIRLSLGMPRSQPEETHVTRNRNAWWTSPSYSRARAPEQSLCVIIFRSFQKLFRSEETRRCRSSLTKFLDCPSWSTSAARLQRNPLGGRSTPPYDPGFFVAAGASVQLCKNCKAASSSSRSTGTDWGEASIIDCPVQR